MFWKRKVKIFSKMVPLWLVIFLAVAGIAAAAFASILAPNVSLTAKDLEASFEAPVCSVIGAGTISECTPTQVTGSGFDDDSVVHLDIVGRNDSTTIAYNMTFSATAPAGVSAITCVLADPPWSGAPCDGDTIPANTGGFAIDVEFVLGDLVASQIVDDFVFQLEMSE